MIQILLLDPIRRAPFALVALLSVFFLTGCGVMGSGQLVEERFDVEQYDSISLGDGFTGKILQGSEFSVVVEADDNLIDDVHVRVDSGTLRVDLGNLRTRRATLRATLTLPRLARASVNDGGSISSRNVPLSDSFSLELSGGSRGQISQNSSERFSSLLIDSSGGSSFDLVGNADSTLIDITGGGSGELKGTTDTLILSLSGGSSLSAPAFVSEHLSFEMSGGSSADVFVTHAAQGRLSGGSSLAVSGGAEVNAKKSEGSTVTTH